MQTVSSDISPRPSLMREALVLAALIIPGPFAIDMFLPAMPDITRDLGTSIAATQMTLTAYFMAFGLAQMAYGPWSDAAGRKKPLYLGLVIFLIGTLACTFATSIGLLIAARVFQALGAAVLMVVPRAIIRDRHTGESATRLMALVMLVMSVSPMLAPLAGSLLMGFGGWRVIFGVLALAAALALFLTFRTLPETLATQDRRPVNAASMMAGIRQLSRDRSFMGLTLVGGFGMASFFVYIAMAPFVFTGAYGLSPQQFSLAFAVNAVGFFLASQAAAGLGARFGATRVVVIATCGFATFATLLGIWAALAPLPMVGLILGLALGNACLGLVIPTAMVLALEDHGPMAGLASSYGGTLQMVIGGGMIGVTGIFFDGSPARLILAILICAALAVISVIATRPKAALPA
ncbi:multidrug effflux MFS transporter [Marinovum sp. 2_MG-2023]|uniref:multidrug effflux MFS transporter n=1 Tax=Roseobacteraceae TaxID=2854170 RepID=UPI001FD2130C|nr:MULTISPECIES: multidrug effflux MFS transporter [Roseobacteraceae]MCJ7871790.1 multidrug effflux MFS transporter [Phaeobacter sp. J2-8]MDO6728630.1 multidrug effflux MFS transporter [Marinovum sp. 2_MG-2023]MDO6777954.1 multidrug effflux MFS transporter [Marinovum sp. 1_MG-2023]